jgi:hypothetical protein
VLSSSSRTIITFTSPNTQTLKRNLKFLFGFRSLHHYCPKEEEEEEEEEKEVPPPNLRPTI